MSSFPVIGSGLGDTFEFATTASPTTFTTLSGVDSIALSGDKVKTNSTLTMASTTGAETFLGSTQNPGTFAVKGFWLPGEATQVALEAIRLAAQAVPIKITYGTSNSCSFSGIIESFTPTFPLDKPPTFDLKGQISGLKTYV